MAPCPELQVKKKIGPCRPYIYANFIVDRQPQLLQQLRQQPSQRSIQYVITTMKSTWWPYYWISTSIN